MAFQSFSENQKILCYHGEFLYEAKIIKVETLPIINKSNEQPQKKYLVHYNGWNKTWDEWVSDSRLLYITEDNLFKQKQLFHSFEIKQGGDRSKTKKKKMSDKISFNSQDIINKSADSCSATAFSDENRSDSLKYDLDDSEKKSRGQSGQAIAQNNILNPEGFKNHRKKRLEKDHNFDASETNSNYLFKKGRKIRYVTSNEDIYMKKTTISISIPTELKLLLIDDNDLINRQQNLVAIPKRISVIDILNRFCEDRAEGDQHFGIIDHFCLGIKEYFDISLGMELLFKFERPQYCQLVLEYPDKVMSEIYGIEHLLRLFVRISDFLSYTMFESCSIEKLDLYFTDFLIFLEENISTFQIEYTPVTQEYVRRI